MERRGLLKMITTRLTGVLCITILLFLGTGCSHTRTIGPDTPDAYDQLSEIAAGQTVQVILRGGGSHQAQALQVNPDSTSWYTPNEEETVRVSTDEIAAIRQVVNRNRGGWQGLGIGFLVGALTGAVVASSTDGCGDFFSTGACALIGAGLFGGPGLLVGVAAGAMVGSEETYRFERPGITAVETPPAAADTNISAP